MNRLSTVIPAAALSVLAALLAGGGCEGVVDPAAEKDFLARRGSMTITVLPAFLRDGRDGGYDDAAATTLETFLEEAKLATVTVSDAHVPLRAAPGWSQSKLLRESLAGFTAWLREHPVDTDYAMLPEYLLDGRGHGIGVHLYVLSADGRCAYAIGLNSHHEPFRRVNPKSTADCTQILIDVMRGELVQEAAPQ